MSDNRKVRSWLLASLAATTVIPVIAACAGANNGSGAQGAASVGMQTPPPGWPPGYPYPPPPGYGYPPGAYPPPGGTAPPGYPPGYPGTAAPPPGYPATGAPPAGYPPPGATAPPGYPPPGYPPAAGQPTAAAPSGSAAPPLAPTDPNSLQGILQGIQGAMQGTVVPGGGTVPGDLTEAGLRAYALKSAPGMQPDGDELKQTLNEGQHAVMMITMQAGKCYTVVGYSAPGAVADVDLNMLAPPLYMTLAGQDLTHNNTPTIGGGSGAMCPVIAFPLQYKLDVFARKGSGVVAVQLFSKPKK
jgi:hypothetical protein